MSTQINLEAYTEKSFVLRGEGTRQYSSLWRQNSGSWNERLKGGPGWIFSNRQYQTVVGILQQIKNNTLPPTNQVTADQLDHKKLTYRVYQPELNQTLTISGIDGQYVVINILAKDNSTNVIDTVYIQPIANTGTQEQISLLQVINGKWQIRGFVPEHTVNFTPRQAKAVGIPTVSMPQNTNAYHSYQPAPGYQVVHNGVPKQTMAGAPPH